MSAKWRRNRRNFKFDIVRALDEHRDKHFPRMIRIRDSWIKRQDRAHDERNMKNSLQKKPKEPEPLIDVLDDDDSIAVVAELAGFERKNINVRVEDLRLTLSAKSLARKYHKSLNLPSRVIASTIHTKYTNGVLEIRLKKNLEEKVIDEVAGQKNAT